MVFLGLIICVLGIAYFFSALFVLALVLALFSGNLDLSNIGAGPTLACIIIFAIGTVCLVYAEKEKAKTKGRECGAVCLDGLPGFKREQAVHLTLDIKDLSLLFDDRKDQKVALKFQQITKLNYIDWEGDITRWVEGSNGYSYPGLFEGTRVYVPPTEGYAKTEKLRVKRALEIQYRDQKGIPRSIVLDISKDSSYTESLVESLCRCTRLPVPQYIPPVKPAKPGTKYL